MTEYGETIRILQILNTNHPGRKFSKQSKLSAYFVRIIQWETMEML